MNVDQFRQAVRSAGLEPPDVIEPGRLYRFSTNGKCHDDAGWCKLFPDGQGGVFGDFRSGLSETWQATRDRPFTPSERETFRQRCEAERKAREAEQARAHAEAREKAAEILKGATGDPAAHPYAVKKKVPLGPLVRRGTWPQRGWTDALLVPIYDGSERIWSVEAINADGDKDSLKDGRKTGGFHPLGTIHGASRVLIAEGLANAAVGWAVDGSPAVAAMGKANLIHTALAVQKLAPEAEIIIIADNDLKDPKEAQDAAQSTGGRVVVPELDGRECDAWDLWHERGAEAVRDLIYRSGSQGDSTQTGQGGTIEAAIAMLITDIGAVFEPKVVEALKAVRASSPANYQRYRRRIKDAGASVAELDRLVCATESEPDSQGDAVLFPEIEPWPTSVDGAKLLTDLASTCRRYAVLPRLADVAVALWIVVFAHAIDFVNIAPILAITSPEKRCGKTTLLALLRRLARRPLPASNISPAALFRAVEAWSPTLLIDEADSFLRNSEELRGILNSGHTRDSSYVIRTVGEDHEPRRFSTWGAKSIALIGRLPDTLADRSIEVPLKRKLRGERVEKLRHADPGLFSDLARRCARWATDHADEIRAARPSLPDGLHDRAQDNWESLIAIADLAGGDWPKLAREAALALSGAVDAADDTRNVQLLSDIRDVFEDYEDDIQRTDKEGDALRTAVLIDRLCAIEDHPWATASKGKRITAELLARKLKPFRVKPKQYWVDGKKERGYLLNDLKDPFHRYLADQPGRPGRTQAECGSQPFSQPGMNPNHTGYENRPEPSCGAGPTGSTGCERDVGGREGDRETWTI